MAHELTDDELMEHLSNREIDFHETPSTHANSGLGSEWSPVEFDSEEFVALVYGLMNGVMEREDVPADVRRLARYLAEEADKGVLHYTMH